MNCYPSWDESGSSLGEVSASMPRTRRVHFHFHFHISHRNTLPSKSPTSKSNNNTPDICPKQSTIMLSIQPSKTQQKCTPNLLPARINHNGPINNTSQYWKPDTDSEGTKHAYFRGRHLHGTAVPLPSNYTGAILNNTERDLPESAHDKSSMEEEEGDDNDAKVEVKIAEQIGVFDEMMVWKHGAVVDEKTDIYVRGVGEWIGFAEAMHCEEDSQKDEDKKG